MYIYIFLLKEFSPILMYIFYYLDSLIHFFESLLFLALIGYFLRILFIIAIAQYFTED